MYHVGDTVRLQATTTDPTGEAVDPDALTAKVVQPDGTVITETWPGDDTAIERTGAGTFHLDLVTTQRGEHLVQWTATGPSAGAESDRFYAVGELFE